MRDLRERLDVNVGTRAAILAAEGTSTVDTLDRATMTDICVDVLASKVSRHSDVRELRDEIEDTISDTEGDLS